MASQPRKQTIAITYCSISQQLRIRKGLITKGLFANVNVILSILNLTCSLLFDVFNRCRLIKAMNRLISKGIYVLSFVVFNSCLV